MEDRKKRIQIYFLSGIILLFAAFYCYKQREEISERIKAGKIISYIYLHHTYVNLEYIKINQEEKFVRCEYIMNSPLNRRLDKINETRRDIEQFLENNSDYFLNDSYELSFIFTTKSGSEHVIITNRNPYENAEIVSMQLRHVSISVQGIYDVSQLYGYYDMETLDMNIMPNGGIYGLEDFNDLKYIAMNRGFKKEDEERIHEMLPNCQIVNSSSLDFFSEPPR